MKTYIDGLQKALELLNNNPCDADGYHYCSQQDTYKNLIEAEIKVSRVELPVKPEIADNKDLINFLTFIAERLRLKDDDFINDFTKYGIVDYIIRKIKNNDIQ